MLLSIKNFFTTYLSYLSLEISLQILQLKPGRAKLYNSIAGITSSSKLLFAPYGSLDCLLLHRFFRNSLSKRVKSTKLFINNESIDFNKFLTKRKSPNEIDNYTHSNFQNELKNLCEKHNLIEIYLPLLDSIESILDYSQFFEELLIDENLFFEIHKLINRCKKLANEFDILFLADSAYLTNAILKQTFIRNNRKVYFLNPDGFLLKYCGKNCTEYYYCDNNSQINLKSKEINKYTTISRVKHDSTFSLGEAINTGKIKKVLYAHILRDAKMMNPDQNQIFCNSIDWFEFMLAEISRRDDWNNWYLKIHPYSIMYKNEKELFDQYMLKYKVPEKVYKFCPDKNQILSTGMLIYTFSGTIVAESLIQGYKTIFCGDRFPSTFGIYCDSKDDLTKYIYGNADTIDNRTTIDDGSVINGAESFMKFWYGTNYKNISRLVPERPCLPGDSSLQRLILMFNQFRKILFKRIDSFDSINI